MRHFITVYLFLVPVYLSAQPTFQKQIRRASIQSGDSLFHANSYIQLQDGSIHLGQTFYVNNINTMPTIVKLNNQGDAVWTKRRFNQNYNPGGASAIRWKVFSAVQDSPTQFTFVSRENFNSRTDRKCINCLLVTSMDTSLNVLWETLIRGGSISNLVQFSDRSYALVIDNTPVNSDRDYTYLVLISAEGEVMSQYLLPDDWHIHHLAVTIDDQLLFAGAKNIELVNTQIGSTIFPSLNYANGLFGKMDRNGLVRWLKTSRDFVVHGTERTQTGAFILFGSGADDAFTKLMAINSEGNTIWNKQLPLATRNLGGQLTLSKQDDIYIQTDGLANETYPGLDPRNSTQISKLSSTGDVLWTKVIPYGFPFFKQEGIFETTAESALRYTYSPDDEDVRTAANTNLQIDADGNLENCLLPKICIESEDMVFNWQDTVATIAQPAADTLVWQQISGTTWGEIPSFVWRDNCIAIEFPSADFEVPEDYCPNTDLELVRLPDDAFDTYKWTFSNATPDQSDERNPGRIQYERSGNFEIQLITSLNNCLDTTIQTIPITELPNLNLPNDTLLCEATSFDIDATIDDFEDYLWSDGVATAQRSINSSGRYILEARQEKCRILDSIQVDFLVDRFPSNPIQLGVDTTICEDDLYNITASVEGADTYFWNDGVTTAERVIETAGNYTVQVNINHCFWQSSIMIEEQDCNSYLYIPNAFSPNNDTVNDFLEWHGQQIHVQVFQIFDRWGNLVFDSINDFWDGSVENNQKAPEGIYTYYIVFQPTLRGGQEQQTGTIQLIR